MKIVVLVKLVPSSEARIRIAPDGRSIDSSDIEFVANPYDEYAVEAALQLREEFGGEVLAITAGPERAAEMLRKACLALGVDRALLIRDDALADADAAGVARALAAACRREQPDLVVAGKQGIDFEYSATGPLVGALLGWPHVAVITKLEAVGEKTLRVMREIEGGMEEIEIDLPAVLTANKGLNEPRYASLKGIMAAKKKPLDTIDLSGLGLSAAEVAPRSVLDSLETPPVRAEAGKILQGETVADKVGALVRLLREEARVI